MKAFNWFYKYKKTTKHENPYFRPVTGILNLDNAPPTRPR